jgi:hypothetical protein
MTKRSFIVTLEVPSGVTIGAMCGYIEDEVKAGIGHYPPEDPIFNLDRSSVRVRVMKGKADAKAS